MSVRVVKNERQLTSMQQDLTGAGHTVKCTRRVRKEIRYASFLKYAISDIGLHT